MRLRVTLKSERYTGCREPPGCFTAANGLRLDTIPRRGAQTAAPRSSGHVLEASIEPARRATFASATSVTHSKLPAVRYHLRQRVIT